MKLHSWTIIGLALALAFTLTLSLPGNARAQKQDPAVGYDQSYSAGDYGYNGGYMGAYCPMGSGNYGPGPGYRNHGPRSWNPGNQGAWCSWDTGYAGNNRGTGGYCW